VLAQRRNVSANAAEVGGTFRAAKTPGDFLFDLEHAQVALSLIIIKGHGEVVHEGEDRLAMRAQPIEQISGRCLLGTPALPGRWRRRVSLQTFVKETSVSRVVSGALFGGQGRLSGGAGLGNRRFHPEQQFDQLVHPGLPCASRVA